jgi:cysteine synthase B
MIVYDPTLEDAVGNTPLIAVDELALVDRADAEEITRRLAREEGIFGGICSDRAAWVAAQVRLRERNAAIVFVVCDQGGRYRPAGVFPA